MDVVVTKMQHLPVKWSDRNAGELHTTQLPVPEKNTGTNSKGLLTTI